MKVGVVRCRVGGMATARALARRGHEVVLREHCVEPVSALKAARAYACSRMRHVVPYQFISRVSPPLFQAHGRFWPMVRDLVFTPLSRLPGIRRLGAAALTGTFRLGRRPDATRP
ncbi:MAG: hypothetical protein ACOY4K_08895 [Pseudomonadota bacterium]